MVFARTDARDVCFSALALLQIAEEVDRKAAAFYRVAAEQSRDGEQRRLHDRLASRRRRHQDTLRRMQREHAEATAGFGGFDSDDYVLSNPRVMAGLTWSGTNPLPRGRFIRYADTTQILRDAITRSKGIVIFYHGLKGFVDTPDSLAVIDDLIDWENRHVRLLHRMLARIQGLSGRSSTPRAHAFLAQS